MRAMTYKTPRKPRLTKTMADKLLSLASYAVCQAEELHGGTPEECKDAEEITTAAHWVADLGNWFLETKAKTKREADLERLLQRQAESHSSIGMVLQGPPTDAGLQGCIRQCNEFVTEAHAALGRMSESKKPSGWRAFDSLAKRLIEVPKSEVDAKVEQARKAGAKKKAAKRKKK